MLHDGGDPHTGVEPLYRSGDTARDKGVRTPEIRGSRKASQSDQRARARESGLELNELVRTQLTAGDLLSPSCVCCVI